jgi:hypothetical protein
MFKKSLHTILARLWDGRVVQEGYRLTRPQLQAKKCGVGNGDPNLRSQPRLPGSVVGEASMIPGSRNNKITEAIGL